MFRIRRIYDNILPVNQRAISQVQRILKVQFPHIKDEDIYQLPDKLKNPIKHGFRSILFVAEDGKGKVLGFAFLLHNPNLHFCFLEYISAAEQLSGRGVGGAIYDRIRHEAKNLNTIGVFFECLPDDPELSRDPIIRRQNALRLKFYENFGARPIVNTAYETPLDPDDDNPPYLVYDSLGNKITLTRDKARIIVRHILERKYGGLCSPQYVNMVVSSFKDNPVRLRDFKYLKKEIPLYQRTDIPPDRKIVLAINDQHDIHHIRERGYVESPIRIKKILNEIEITGLFEKIPLKQFSEKHILSVHDVKFVKYLKRVCKNLPPGRSIYPYVFPIRNTTRPPKLLAIRAGYYCIDTFTPLNHNAYLAAKRAIDCVLSAVSYVLKGTQLGYVLVRPPGHHAEWGNFGGFCYFNTCAVAAQFLSKYGKVAILDIDYHHGNGQQDIFYQRSDVLTISIHGHPSFAYPYFSGFSDEKGFGLGLGFNINYPLPQEIDGKKYSQFLEKALIKMKKFKPDFLIIALGLDTAKGDPTGSWNLKAKDFERNGELIGSLRIPSLVVQEGGYNQKNIGINAQHFFSGLWKGFYKNN